MKNFKRTLALLLAILMMATVLVACDKDDDKNSDATEKPTTVETQAETEAETEVETEAQAPVDTDANDTTTITEDEAIELVKQQLSGDFSYIPADELETIDGNEYYVIYVKQLLDAGTYTTMATYMVKTDGTEVYDKDAGYTSEDDSESFYGEYVRSYDGGESIFTVNEDNTFEMTMTGDVNQTVTGVYKFGVTNSADVIKLNLSPRTIVTELNGETTKENVSGREGTAVIENGELTLSMESEDSVYTKR